MSRRPMGPAAFNLSTRTWDARNSLSQAVAKVGRDKRYLGVVVLEAVCANA